MHKGFIRPCQLKNREGVEREQAKRQAQCQACAQTTDCINNVMKNNALGKKLPNLKKSTKIGSAKNCQIVSL